MTTYQLTKLIWDDDDFSDMGWHDTTLWSMHANPDDFEFVVDLDYIFSWVCPASGKGPCEFWVAPVTMVFENVGNVRIHIESSQGTLEVAALHRTEIAQTPNGKLTHWRYRFECQEGEATLTATGFKMFVRRPPVLVASQRLGFAQRQGVDFGRAFLPA